MRIFIDLLKLQLNVNFGLSALKYRFTKEKKRLWEPVLIGLSAFVGIGSIAFLFTMFMIGTFIAGKSIGYPEMVLTIAFMGGPLVVLFFGIFYIMSAFYFSKDMDILIPLPIKPYHILGSKFAVVMINEYLTLIPVILPAILVYGIGTSQGFVYWIKAVALFALSPVLPLTAGALFVVFIMRFINIRKSKDLLAIIGGVAGMAFGLGVNFFVQRIPHGQEGEYFRNFLASSDFINIVGSKFPPSVWATYSLSKQGLQGVMYFALYAAVSLGLLLALLWVGNKLFYKSILSGQEVARKRKVFSSSEIDKKHIRETGTIAALFIKEWKLLLRTPVFALNGLAGVLVGPIMLVMMFSAQDNEARELLAIINSPEHVVYASLGGLALMLFTSGINIVASTSVSREGNSFWISKMIPVSPGHQVLSKLLHSSSVSLIGLVVTAILLVSFAGFAILRTLVLMCIGMLGATLIAALSLIIDVLRPKLEWTNPQEAVKQNFNCFLGILIAFLVLGILAVVAGVLLMLELPEVMVYLLMSLTIILLLIPSVFGLLKLAVWKYNNIEV